MAPNVERKLAELEIGLNNMLENSEIPDLQLEVHPTVSSIIGKCKQENRKPKVEDYDGMTDDSKFLNQLQAGVNKWVKDIQNVSLFSSKFFSFYTINHFIWIFFV